MFKKKKIGEQQLVKLGLVAGLLEVSYMFMAGTFLLTAETLFHPASESMIVGLVSFLILLVTGVALSGVLIFAYPIFFFLQKQYREAIIYLITVLGFVLAVFILLILGEIYLY